MRVDTMHAALSLAYAGVVLAGCGNRPFAPPACQPPSAGESAAGDAIRPQAFVFAGTTRDGEAFRLEDHRGKTVLLNFFSPT